jgi:hypothetical protein
VSASVDPVPSYSQSNVKTGTSKLIQVIQRVTKCFQNGRAAKFPRLVRLSQFVARDLLVLNFRKAKFPYSLSPAQGTGVIARPRPRQSAAAGGDFWAVGVFAALMRIAIAHKQTVSKSRFVSN